MRIALTGGIGTGKSALATILRQWGHPVIDADSAAHHLYACDPGLRRALAEHFGAEILTTEGVDRTALGQIVFSDPAQLALLESLVHPPLRQYLESELARLETSHPLVFLEGAVLPRWPQWLLHFAGIIEVQAQEAPRRRRLELRGLDAATISQRLEAQKAFPPVDHPRHWVLNNEGTLGDLEDRAGALLEEIRGQSF